MKPWREVLAERGWTTANEIEASIAVDGYWKWTVLVAYCGDGTYAASLLHEHYAGDCTRHTTAEGATENAAFTALMAKPIGPGQVTIGTLLGVEDALHA